MTADLVNLKQFRKRQARAEKERLAEQNRITFGRTKAERELTEKLNEKAGKALDGGRIERPDKTGGDKQNLLPRQAFATGSRISF
jgi:hypothetical protein